MIATNMYSNSVVSGVVPNSHHGEFTHQQYKNMNMPDLEIVINENENSC